MGSYLEYAKKRRKEEEEKNSSSSNTENYLDYAKKRRTETEESTSSSGSDDYLKYATGRRLGLDTLESDLSEMGNTISGIYSGWQTQETMANTLETVKGMKDRLDKYAAYQKKYMPDSTFDVDTLSKDYQKVIDDWGGLTKTYGQFKDADTYNNYQSYLKSKEEENKQKEENLKKWDNAFEPYAHHLDREDADELSQYKTTIENRKFLWMDDRYIGDEVYEYINNFDGKIRGDLLYQHDKYQVGSPIHVPSKYKEMGLDYLKPEEKKVFNIIYSESGKEAAHEFLKDMEPTLLKRANDQMVESIKGDETGGWLGDAAMSIASVPMMVGGGIYSGIESLSDRIKGENNPYSIYHSVTNAASAIREDVSEEIETATDGLEVFGANPLSQLYNFAMSTADSLLGVGSLGKLYSITASSNAYQQTAKELTEAGADDDEILTLATASAVFEGLFEYASIEKLFSTKNADSVKNIIKNAMLTQGAFEGAEELFTEGANVIADMVVRGEGSDVISQYKDMLARGYSEGEAKTEMAKRLGSQLGWAFLGGMFSGGFVGGLHGFGQYSDFKDIGSEIRSNDRVSEMLGVASDNLITPNETEAYKLYTEYAKGGVNAENITNAQLGNLYATLENETIDTLRSKKTSQQDKFVAARRLEGLGTVAKAKNTVNTETGNVVKVEGVKTVDGERVLQTSEGEVKGQNIKLSHTDAELNAYAEGMDDSKASLLWNQYDGSTDVESYVESFNLMHSYGETGYGTDYALQHKGVLTDAQAIAIYKEGIASKARESADAFRYTVDEIVGEGMTVQKFDDSIIDYDGTGTGSVKLSSLTRSERENLGLAKLVASGLNNVNVKLISSTVENGRYVGEHGSWDAKTRTIYLDVHAGLNRLGDSNSYMASTLSHEVTHSFETAASEEYAELRDHVLNYLSSREGQDVPTLIQMKREKLLSSQTYKKNGITDLADDIVIKEIVADACEEMLVNSKKVDEILNGLDENTKKSFIGKVKETFENIIGAIKAAINKLDPRTREAKALRESQEDFEKALELWDKAFAKANEVRSENLTEEQAVKNTLNEIGLDYDSETGTVYSMRSLEEAFNYNDAEEYLRSREEYVNALVKATGKTKAEANRYLDSLFLVHDMIASDQDKLDYKAAVNKTSWVSNTEYGGSIDFSTLCAKRRLFTGTFDAIQNALPNTVLTDKDYLNIRNLLLEKGLEAPCSMCYVEGSRAKAGEYINKWLQEYLKTNPKWKPQIADFASATRLEQTRIQHPDAYAAYQEAMNKLAQRKPKEASVRTDYKGEILVAFADGSSVEIKNLNGGIRFNSFSDFEIIHTLDCMQVITDMARVGLAGQGYTKVKEFAKCFGNTGLKINLSLVAKDVDANGRLIFDEVNGMSYADAMELRNEFSENVGTVIVCFNVDQIKAALADDTIDYILPFHRSQWRKSQYALMGLPTKTKDFTMYQNDRIRNPQTGRPVKLEKVKHISHYTNDVTGQEFDIKGNIMPNQYWDYSKSGRENAQRYLDYINANGMTPKFDFVLEKANGKWVLPNNAVGDGYFKLLIDFKMYNNEGVGSPQKPVLPEFNMPFIHQLLKDYKGGHSTFPVAHDVVDKFVSDYKKNHPREQYSDRDSDGTQLTKEQMEFFKDSKVRDENGNLKVMYHGTERGAGFTVFDNEFSDDGRSFFFTDQLTTAKGYSGSYSTYAPKALTSVEEVNDEIGKDLRNIGYRIEEEDGEYVLYYENYMMEKSESLDELYRTFEEGYGSGLSATNYKVYLNITNPLNVNAEGNMWDEIPFDGNTASTRELAEYAHTKGYDGVIISDVNDNSIYAAGKERFINSTVVIAFNSNQIKSVANTNPTTDADIRYSDRIDNFFFKDFDLDEMIETLIDEDIDLFLNDNEETKLSPKKERAKRRVDEVNKRLKKLGLTFNGTKNLAWTDERIDKYLGGGYYGSSNPKYAQAYIAYVTPQQFLNLTVGGKTRTLDTIEHETKQYGDIDFEKLGDSSPIFLEINEGKTKAQVDGHEGRHRMLMLGRAGFEKVPVLLFDYRTKYDKTPKSEMKLIAQRFNNTDLISSSRNTVINDVIPFSHGNRDIIIEKFGSGNKVADVRFSDRYEDAWFELFDSDGSMAESAVFIEEDVNRLKERLSLGETKFDDTQVKAIAKHLLNKANSKYNTDALMEDLKDIYGYIDNTDSLDGNALMAKCYDVARNILNEMKETKVTNDYAKMVMKDIRATKIKLDDKQIQEAKNRYGENYRKSLWGRIFVTNDGISLDSKWGEWSTQYPDIFDANISSADQITELADIYDSLKMASEVKQEYDTVNDVRAIGAEIYNQYWIRSTTNAVSDEYESKIRALNLKHRDTMKRLRDDYQKRLDDKKNEIAIMKNAIRSIRLQKEAEVRTAKRLGKEKMDAYKERVAKNAKIEQITQKALTLNKWMKGDPKKNAVPEIMQKPVIHLLDAIDFSSKQMLKGGKPTKNDKRLAEAFSEVEKMALKIDASNARIENSEVEEMYINLPSCLVYEIEQMSKTVNALTNAIGDSTYVLNDMSLEDLEKFDMIITTLKNIITSVNECHKFHYERGIKSLASNLISYLEKFTDKKVSNLISNFFEYDNATPLSVFKRLGEHGMVMFEGFQDSWDTFAEHIKQIKDFTNGNKKKGIEAAYTKKEVREWRNKTEIFTVLDTKRSTKDDPKYKKVTMTHAQIMGLYLLNEREQAKGHIYGGGIRIADIRLKGKTNPITDAEGFTVTKADVLMS